MKNSDSNSRIRILLNELGISQTEFCNKTGITKSALSNYLNGDRQPRQDQLDKIAKAYDINPAWLMGYDVSSKIDINLRPPVHNPDITIQKIYKSDDPMDRIREYAVRYAALISAAKGCTDDQIAIATNLLNEFKKKKED